MNNNSKINTVNRGAHFKFNQPTTTVPQPNIHSLTSVLSPNTVGLHLPVSIVQEPRIKAEREKNKLVVPFFVRGYSGKEIHHRHGLTIGEFGRTIGHSNNGKNKY